MLVRSPSYSTTDASLTAMSYTKSAFSLTFYFCLLPFCLERPQPLSKRLTPSAHRLAPSAYHVPSPICRLTTCACRQQPSASRLTLHLIYLSSVRCIGWYHLTKLPNHRFCVILRCPILQLSDLLLKNHRLRHPYRLHPEDLIHPGRLHCLIPPGGFHIEFFPMSRANDLNGNFIWRETGHSDQIPYHVQHLDLLTQGFRR